MTLNPQFAFALEYVADIDAAKRFYVDVLGLEVAREHPTFVQFKDASGSHFAIASDEPLNASGEPELYWQIDDAAAAFRALSAKADVSLPLTQKPFGTVFAVNDADGRPRYLIEFARNRPSQQVR
jgi:catechol 2,3-dioxygenase-like lactoylglutathione lyase family enzyme